MYLPQKGKAGQNNGLKQKARLYYPVRSAAKRHSLYVAEHPVESQRAIRMLEGFTRFLSVWHAIPVSMAVAEGMRMVSKRAKLNDPLTASQTKNTLPDTLPDLKIASQRLEA